MNELFDFKSAPKADHAANSEKQTWLAGAVDSAFDTFKQRPLESAGGALAAATLGVASVRLKAPVLEKLAATEGAAVAKSRLHYGVLPEVPAGQVAIPSFVREGGPARELMRTVPEIKIVSADSVDAKVFLKAKNSIIPIFSGDRTRGATGFLADESGHIVTANHVVSDPRQPYFVRLFGDRVPAKLIARDVTNDLAILKVDTNFKGVRPLELNLNSNEVTQGREAFLIGFPDGAARRVMTKGPVERLDFIGKIGGDADFVNGSKTEVFKAARLLHKVPSFAGNSGGPLLLDNGLVAGVHSIGNYYSEFARATSVHHLPLILDAVRQRTMVQGVSEYTTAVKRKSTLVPKSIAKPSDVA